MKNGSNDSLKKKEKIDREIKRLHATRIKPNAKTQELIKSIGGSELKDGILASDLLKRPEMKYDYLKKLIPAEEELSPEIEEQVEIQIKYEGYISKALQQVERLKKMEDKKSHSILITMRFKGWRMKQEKI